MTDKEHFPILEEYEKADEEKLHKQDEKGATKRKSRGDESGDSPTKDSKKSRSEDADTHSTFEVIQEKLHDAGEMIANAGAAVKEAVIGKAETNGEAAHGGVIETVKEKIGQVGEAIHDAIYGEGEEDDDVDDEDLADEDEEEDEVSEEEEEEEPPKKGKGKAGAAAGKEGAKGKQTKASSNGRQAH